MTARAHSSLTLVAFLIALISRGDCAHADAPRPNIVFILADDLGYGDLGCYGQKQIRTPHLDRMASQGVRFTNFYAGSTVCAPSRCVLMTGHNTGRCSIRGNGQMNLPADQITVAEMLHQAGYATGLFGKWGLGAAETEGSPLQQGFDEYFGYLDQQHAHNYYPTFLMHNDQRVKLPNVVQDERESGAGVATERVQYSADLIADHALEFIDRNHEKPFFLYFAATLPHANNEAGQRGMEIPDFGPYADLDWPEPQKGLAAMISRLDSDVGRVLDRLAQHGIDDRTIVMFSSDNGPHSEGGNDPEFFNSNGPLRGKKRSLADGGIRVPMIVRWPGVAPTGTVADHVGYFGDLFATSAELSGANAPSGLDSISFAPSIRGDESAQKPHEYLYWEFYERGSAQAARFGDWKAIAEPMGSDAIEVYDLRTDVGEEHDIASTHPEIAQRAKEIFARAHVPSPDWQPRGEPRSR